jgi:hypothetical protein
MHNNFAGECRPPNFAQAQIVMSAELNAYNLPSQAADYLTDLLPCMCPDQKLPVSMCKHTKAKAIICDALDSHLETPIVYVWKTSPFNESNERGDME